MTKSKKSILLILSSVFLISSFAFARFADKTDFSIGKGPDKKTLYITSNVSAPFPTNDWWTSIAADTYSSNLFSYPWNYKCKNTGLEMGYTDTILGNQEDGSATTAAYSKQIQIKAKISGTSNFIDSASTKVDGYGDWSVTSYWEDQSDNTKSFKATIGHGFVFTYFDFSAGLEPVIIGSNISVYNKSGLKYAPGAGTQITADYICVYSEGKYFGIFAPDNTVFHYENGQTLRIVLGSSEKYLSIGLLTQTTDSSSIAPSSLSSTIQAELSYYSDYAYAFITDTKITWDVEFQHTAETDFNLTVAAKKSGQNTALIAILPHQWRNTTAGYDSSRGFDTIRGRMKFLAANTFTTTNKFYGILPFLPDQGTYDKDELYALLQQDSLTTLTETEAYKYGKQLYKIASLIPVAYTLDKDTSTMVSSLISEVRSSIVDRVDYQSLESEYFYYDDIWGGVISYPHEAEYDLNNYTDHHFNYAYFIYAAAIAALHMPGPEVKNFISKTINEIEEIIYDYACPDRDNSKYPFLRNFDPYAGHSWANGFALGLHGNDQESSSEAMLSWSAIYLWSLAIDKALASGYTGLPLEDPIGLSSKLKELAIWGYTQEYSALKEYYFDMNEDVFPSEYDYSVAGQVFGSKLKYNTYFTDDSSDSLYEQAKAVYAIQILPINSSMFYLGQNSTYAASFLQDAEGNNSNSPGVWHDMFCQFESLYNPSGALQKYNDFKEYTYSGGIVSNLNNTKILDNNSYSNIYHFIHNLNGLGTQNLEVYCSNYASYGYFVNGNKRNFVCYNPDDEARNFAFYRISDGYTLGYVTVEPFALKVVQNLSGGDTTPPGAVSSVIDGNTAEDQSYTNSNSLIYANWAQTSDSDSGLYSYWYSLGTSAGAADVVTWQAVGLTNSASINASMTTATTYYVNVRAENWTGVYSGVSSSNGIYVDTITPSVSNLASSSHPNSSTWYNTNSVNISFNAQDAHSGVKQYYYLVDSVASRSAVYIKTNGVLATSTNFLVNNVLNGNVYIHVISEDNAGNLSAPIVKNFKIDITQADISQMLINDGAAGDIDGTISQTELYANWSGAVDSESGINLYEYGVSSSPTNEQFIVTGSTTETNIKIDSLSLTEGQWYYFYVRVLNNTGIKSAYKVSDGQIYDPNTPRAEIELVNGTNVKSGEFQVKVHMKDVYGIPNAPSLKYVIEGSSEIAVSLMGSGNEWTGTSFINSNTPNGKAVFVLSAASYAGLVGTQVSSGKTFTIDTSLDADAGGIVSNDDGTKIEALPNTFIEKVKIIITPLKRTDNIIGSANDLFVDLRVQEFLGLHSIYREFDARRTIDDSLVDSFNKNVTIIIPYPDVDQDGIVDNTDIEETKLKVFYLNLGKGEWEFVRNSIVNEYANTCSANVPHFSVYGIMPMFKASSKSLSEVIAYPNPCYFGKQQSMVIDNIPSTTEQVELFIYNVAGELIRKFDETDGIQVFGGSKRVKWDGRDDDGNKVASGVYIYLVKTDSDTKTEKVGILW
ncbi:glycosyl hydrolase [bacterium]